VVIMVGELDVLVPVDFIVSFTQVQGQCGKDCNSPGFKNKINKIKIYNIKKGLELSRIRMPKTSFFHFARKFFYGAPIKTGRTNFSWFSSFQRILPSAEL
jgi:hypothetical protein